MVQGRILKAKTQDIYKGTEYRFEMTLFIFREGDHYVVYSPAFDLSSTGFEFNEAFSNFYEAFQLYIEYGLENGTLWEDLEEHGWKKTPKKITQPSFSTLMRKKEMRRLMTGNIGFEKIITPASIPIHA